MSKFNQNLMNQLERAFGDDMSNVRVQSNQGGRNIDAQAFTQGNDIHFNRGPSNNLGRESEHQGLLGHEATHVVQQGQSSGFSKKGAQELMNGNVPSNAVDRARLRSNVQHPGAAGAPLSAGPNSLLNVPTGYIN